MKLLLKKYPPTEDELENEKFLALNQDTSDLYGLIHARYIRSAEGKSVFVVILTLTCILGLAVVYGRYLQGQYGYCPRALCDKQRVLPCGMSDKLRANRVKVFCWDAIGDGFFAQRGAILMCGLGNLSRAVIPVFLFQRRHQHQICPQVCVLQY